MNGILSVSSFCEVCRLSGLSVDFLGAVFACGYRGVRVAAFFEKLAHFLAFVVKVGVVTAEANGLLACAVVCLATVSVTRLHMRKTLVTLEGPI